MAQNQQSAETAMEIDRLATQLAKDPQSKVFMPLAEEYGKVGMWQEAAGVLEDGLKYYPGFITAMVALGRAYDQMGQPTKAKAILEESIKLSPENLRAHRTLIKIYVSQELQALALQSCAVILRVNPRDEEALSVQSALAKPLTLKKEPEKPKSADPVTQSSSAQDVLAAPIISGPLTAAIPEVDTQHEDPSVSTSVKLEAVAPDPLIVASELMETVLHTQEHAGEQLAVPEEDPQANAVEAMPSPSPHANVVLQLEAWLRNIQSRRRDRDTTNRPLSKTSQ
ncbi:MAG: tetratricopeptide repeat protein [Nitrospirota bacterium]|nr:tetratricopeptide repeat protein [Nitrospirota bacterium]